MFSGKGQVKVGADLEVTAGPVGKLKIQPYLDHQKIDEGSPCPETILVIC